MEQNLRMIFGEIIGLAGAAFEFEDKQHFYRLKDKFNRIRNLSSLALDILEKKHEDSMEAQ
jgi:hypothetical protein